MTRKKQKDRCEVCDRTTLKDGTCSWYCNDIKELRKEVARLTAALNYCKTSNWQAYERIKDLLK